MLSIYLCDDNCAYLRKIEEIIGKYLFINSINAQIVCRAQTPAELLAQIEREQTFPGIYFLDVDLQSEMDGFSLAQSIRMLDSRAYIVFITVHDGRFMEACRRHIEPMDFIWKDSEDLGMRIGECLLLASRQCSALTVHMKDELIVRSNGENIYLPILNLHYIETIPATHMLCFHHQNQLLRVRGTMAEYEKELLAHRFYRIHNAYLVNVLSVERLLLREHVVVLKTGERLPVAVRKQRGLAVMME